MGYGLYGKVNLQSLRISPWSDRQRLWRVDDDDEEEALDVVNVHEMLNNLSVRMDAMEERFTVQFDEMTHQVEQWREEVKPMCCHVCDFFEKKPDLIKEWIVSTLQKMNTVKEDDSWFRLNSQRNEEGGAPDIEMGRHVEQGVQEAPNAENIEERIHNLSLRANALEGHIRAQLDKWDCQIKLLCYIKPVCSFFVDLISQNPGPFSLMNK